MSRSRRSALVAFVAIAVMTLTPAAAMACRITNATPWQGYPPGRPLEIKVWFDCGHSCGNYFTIEPGESVSAPGEAGYVQGCAQSVQGMWLREVGTRARVSSGGEARVKTPGMKMSTDVLDTPPKQASDEFYGGTFSWALYDSDNDLTRTVQNDNTLVHGKDWACWDGSP